MKGTENEIGMGTKDRDGPSHQRLLQKFPTKPAWCRRLLGLITAACGGDVGETRVEGVEDDSMTLAAKVVIALLLFLTCMFWCAVRCAECCSLSSMTLSVRIVERGMQTEHKAVGSFVWYSTSMHCKGLRDVPTDAIGSKRSCML